MNKEQLLNAKPKWYVYPGLKQNTTLMTIQRIEEIVCSSPYIMLTPAQLMEKTRRRTISQARTLVCMLAKWFLPNAMHNAKREGTRTGYKARYISENIDKFYAPSYLARKYEFKSHASILTNVKSYEGYYETDAKYKKMVDTIAYKIRLEQDETSKELL
jgi:hypothetical protein